MINLEVTQIGCVWHVFVGDSVKIACQNQQQAERILEKMAFRLAGLEV